jgi:hypothetical protein
MDTPEQMHGKIAKVVRLQCQALCRRLRPDTAAIESVVSERDLGDLIYVSRAWQQAVKSGDLDAIEKCESDFTAAWEKFEATSQETKAAKLT